MTSPGNGADKRARTRPLEMLGVAGVLALFGGLVVLMSTRDIVIALIAFGVMFIVSLVVIAILVLAVNPVDDARKLDPNEPDGH